MNNQVVRTICCFTKDPSQKTVATLSELGAKLTDAGFQVQTKRICAPIADPVELRQRIGEGFALGVGTIPFEQAVAGLPRFYQSAGVSFNIDLTHTAIDVRHTQPLFDIIRDKPGATFNFTYVFNNRPSAPFFPSANYERDGFSVGLQPTDLSEGCTSLEEWLEKLHAAWTKIVNTVGDDPGFLGIDSSIAPMAQGKGSLVNFIKRLGMSFSGSATTDTYLRITKFMKDNNPKPAGLCGLMLPCLEDSELADEYENGNFTLERNLFLSLHSGLGIDTFPIGIDETRERVAEVLRLVQGLSNKYNKPLSARLVSDGKSKIGEKTDFQNRLLKDVTIRPL